jgi:hypothetical protein
MLQAAVFDCLFLDLLSFSQDGLVRAKLVEAGKVVPWRLAITKPGPFKH